MRVYWTSRCTQALNGSGLRFGLDRGLDGDRSDTPHKKYVSQTCGVCSGRTGVLSQSLPSSFSLSLSGPPVGTLHPWGPIPRPLLHKFGSGFVFPSSSTPSPKTIANELNRPPSYA
ncbi:hypothetical protein CC2G_012366 [Coprinopsis cinerea AmutBmut pab1-1]|nr:hypothetical protein CC2G_012366 [Coprinopsis cinerea AmutBmut pab1-1]